MDVLALGDDFLDWVETFSFRVYVHSSIWITRDHIFLFVTT